MGYATRQRLRLDVPAFGFLHVEHEPGVLRLRFRLEPVRAHLTTSADPSQFPDDTSVLREALNDLKAIDSMLLGFGNGLGQIYRPYPFERVSCFDDHFVRCRDQIGSFQHTVI